MRSYLRRSAFRWRGVRVRVNGPQDGVIEAMQHSLSLLVNVSMALAEFELLPGGRKMALEALRRNVALRALNLRFVCSDEVDWLVENVLDRVERLELWYSQIGMEGAQALAQGRAKRLHTLLLGSCDIGGPGESILHQNYTTNEHNVSFTYSTRDTETLSTLWPAIVVNALLGANPPEQSDSEPSIPFSVTSLQLLYCPLRTNGMELLCKTSFPRLERLAARSCLINVNEIPPLDKSRFPSLHSLDLRGNKVGGGDPTDKVLVGFPATLSASFCVWTVPHDEPRTVHL